MTDSFTLAGQTSGDLGSANAGGTDAFLRKIDPDGAIQWTRQLGTTGNEAGSGVVTDGSDSVFVTGATDGALVRPTDGLSDGFLSKYTADGDLIWTRQFGTADADVGHSVSIDRCVRSAHGKVVPGWCVCARARAQEREGVCLLVQTRRG